MMKYSFNEATPYFPTPVGEVIKDELTELNMTQGELAERTGIPGRDINEIVEGRKILTRGDASSLGKVFGVSSSYVRFPLFGQSPIGIIGAKENSPVDKTK